MELASELEPALRVALAWQPARARDALRVVFEFDAKLAGIVARAREPLLAQMRFAWWRERIEHLGSERPTADPLLAELEAKWGTSGAALIPLIDGWEEWLVEEVSRATAIESLARGRGATLAAWARIAGEGALGDRVAVAGGRWALADLAQRTPDDAERRAILEAGERLPPPLPLPRGLRGIAVLDGLAARSLSNGSPLLAGRGAALLALRLGLLGR